MSQTAAKGLILLQSGGRMCPSWFCWPCKCGLMRGLAFSVRCPALTSCHSQAPSDDCHRCSILRPIFISVLTRLLAVTLPSAKAVACTSAACILDRPLCPYHSRKFAWAVLDILPTWCLFSFQAQVRSLLVSSEEGFRMAAGRGAPRSYLEPAGGGCLAQGAGSICAFEGTEARARRVPSRVP